MVRFPHVLQVSGKSTVTTNERGDEISSAGGWEELSECREEPSAGRGSVAVDGTEYSYSSVIYLPEGVEEIGSGEVVRVLGKAGNLRLQGKVLRFSDGQINSRIWV